MSSSGKKPFTFGDLIRILCVFFLPPLAVFLTVGLGKHFWINVLLTIVGLWVCGMIHAVWVIARQ